MVETFFGYDYLTMISKVKKLKVAPLVRLDKKSLFLLLGMTVFSFNVFSEKFLPIVITEAYMPEIAPVSRIAAAYLSLTNRNSSAVTLVNLSSDSAAHVMIHETLEENGMLKMQHLKQLEIGPQQTVKLSPGGKHVMLMGIKLKDNADSIQLNLEFKSGNKQQLTIPILKKPSQSKL